MRIAILSPAYPPAVNGLGDYAVNLGRGLEKDGFEVIYAGLPQQHMVSLENYLTIEANTLAFVKSILEIHINVLWINYSGYGYHLKGYPEWLGKAVNFLSKKGVSVVTFFHETYAHSWSPLNRSFWTKPIQKKVYCSLVKISEVVFCSNEFSYIRICKENKEESKKVINTGIFSNIPVLNINKPLNQRNNSAVIFGTLGRRVAIYKEEKLLRKFIALSGIDSIIDVGSGDSSISVPVLPIPVQIVGALPNEAIAALLQENKYGLIHYPNHLLGKSGIFAAYAGNGMQVFNFVSKAKRALDGLHDGVHFISKQGWAADNFSIENQRMSDEAFYWYQPKRLEMHMDVVRNFLYMLNK